MISRGASQPEQFCDSMVENLSVSSSVEEFIPNCNIKGGKKKVIKTQAKIAVVFVK